MTRSPLFTNVIALFLLLALSTACQTPAPAPIAPATAKPTTISANVIRLTNGEFMPRVDVI